MGNEVHYIIEGVLAVGGFKHDEMTTRLTNMAIDLPKNYVTKNDLTHAIDIIHDRFDKLDAKLEKISQNTRIKRMNDTQ